MDIIFLAHTLDVLGKLMVGFTAIAVHHRFLKEHKVDRKVFSSMKKEQMIGIIGMILIVVAYVIVVMVNVA